MAKFKKVSFIILVCLALTIIGSCIVLYWVNPGFLKKSIVFLVELADKPLPIIGVSVGVFCFTAFQIFSNTNYGKNIYKKAEEQTNNAVAKIESLKCDAEKYYEQAKQINSDTKAILGEFSAKVDNLSSDIVKVCETSPNVKIQALGKEIESKSKEYKQELTEKVENFGKEFESKEQQTINELIKQVDYLTLKLEKVADNYEEPKE